MIEHKTENKVILVTQKTRLENLIYRYNTVEQARFYIEHHGGDFNDYQIEHDVYYRAVNSSIAYIEKFARLQVVDRDHIPNFLFGNNDLVIAVGRDGLVVNVLKYLSSQKLIGVNPDQKRWDGVLLPFCAEDLPKIIPEVYTKRRSLKSITLACATLNDGQTLYGVNDLFVGQKTHTSARYEIELDGKREKQSSSGIIVSTGLGSTGWLKSIITGTAGISEYCGVSQRPVLPSNILWDSEFLYFTVREPYPSTSTGTDIVFGKIEKNCPLKIASYMPENGVIFSDGVEQDFLEFNCGSVATIGLSDRKGNLVV